jgi:polyphosphate kinase 2 (PPK2 family)
MEQINNFENIRSSNRTIVLKFYYLSKEEQAKRLMRSLKRRNITEFSAGDLKEENAG